jgi:hypothetical protein
MAASSDTSPDGSRSWDGLSPEMTAKILAMQGSSTPAPKAMPANTSDTKFTSADVDKILASRKQFTSSDVDNILKNRQAPTVNPAQMGQTSTGNYTNTMQQQGYQPMADQAGNAYLEGQRAGTNFNLDVAKSQFEKAQSEGQTATQLQLPKDIQDKVMQYQNAFKAIDNVEDHYSQALKSPYFGGNFRGGTPFAALAGQTDDRVKQYTTAAELAATPIANGVLNYTQGADSKAAVIEKINDILPNSKDAFNTGSGKLVQLRQMTLNNLINMKQEVSKAANYNTQPIDDAINAWAPKVQENQQWYDKTFGQPNANPQNPNSSFSADAQAQLDKVFNKPQPSPISQFSPVGGQTPMPAAPQPVPGL